MADLPELNPIACDPRVWATVLGGEWGRCVLARMEDIYPPHSDSADPAETKAET